MGRIINLRAARKRATREQSAQRAAQNRIAFGRSKSARALEEAKAALADRLLDAHCLNQELNQEGDDR